MVKKKTKKKSRKRVVKNKKQDNSGFALAWKNLLFFGLLALLSFGLYSYAEEEFYSNMFYLLSIIFGFIGLAFFIALLVFMFLRMMKKK